MCRSGTSDAEDAWRFLWAYIKKMTKRVIKMKIVAMMVTGTATVTGATVTLAPAVLAVFDVWVAPAVLAVLAVFDVWVAPAALGVLEVWVPGPEAEDKQKELMMD